MEQVENTVSNSNSIVVAACLLRRFLETGCITPLFIRLLHSDGCPSYNINFDVQETGCDGVDWIRLV
jgi:hypothetical protein